MRFLCEPKGAKVIWGAGLSMMPLWEHVGTPPLLLGLSSRLISQTYCSCDSVLPLPHKSEPTPNTAPSLQLSLRSPYSCSLLKPPECDIFACFFFKWLLSLARALLLTVAGRSPLAEVCKNHNSSVLCSSFLSPSLLGSSIGQVLPAAQFWGSCRKHLLLCLTSCIPNLWSLLRPWKHICSVYEDV